MHHEAAIKHNNPCQEYAFKEVDKMRTTKSSYHIKRNTLPSFFRAVNAAIKEGYKIDFLRLSVDNKVYIARVYR